MAYSLTTEPWIPVVDTAGEHRMASLRARSTDGKRRDIRGADEQVAWLNRRGSANGFRVEECAVVGQGVLTGRRAGKRISHTPARLRGTLTVTDPDAFVDAVTSGISHGKAYGAGLMLLAGQAGAA